MSNKILIGIVALAGIVAIIGFAPYAYQSYTSWSLVDWIGAVAAVLFFLSVAPAYALWLRSHSGSREDESLPRYQRPPL